MNLSTTASLREISDAVIPAPVSEMKAIEIKASEAQVGDVYNKNTKTHRLSSVKVGPKRATLLDEAGKEVGYLLVDETITVIRAFETPASVEAREAGKARAKILFNIASAQESFNSASAKLAESLAEGQVDPWLMTSVAEAGAELHIWKSVEFAIEHGASETDATAEVANDLLGELVGHRLRGESRSTSQMSNLLEDIAHSAQAKFIRRYATEIKNSIW